MLFFEIFMKRSKEPEIFMKRSKEPECFAEKMKLRCALCDSYHKVYGDLQDHYVTVHNEEMFKETKVYTSLMSKLFKYYHVNFMLL